MHLKDKTWHIKPHMYIAPTLGICASFDIFSLLYCIEHNKTYMNMTRLGKIFEMMRRYLMLAQYTYVALEAMFYPLNALVTAHYNGF